MLDSLLTVGIEAMVSVGGVPATVTRPAPDDTPIATSVLWITSSTDDAPTGSEFTRREVHEVVGLLKADVPTLPRKTRIVAARQPGEASRTWFVDRVVVDEPDLWRALVAPAD